MKKNLIIILSIMMAFATAFTAFAAINTTNETKFENGDRLEKKALPENVVFGKIKSIDANSVTIEVATRKEMEKPESSGQKGTPPGKPQDNKQNGNPPEKPNLDNMFTLTGETKTINISQAEFGKDFRPKDFNANAQGNNNSNNIADSNNEKQKTYADYVIGDYIMIEVTDNTYATAKSVRDAGFGGGMRDMGGRNDKKTPPNN